MDIYSFNKITKPKLEGDTSIDTRPQGSWRVEVRRSDGTIRYPLGDLWFSNVFLNRWANSQLGGGQSNSWYNGVTPVGASSTSTAYTWMDLFYNRSTIGVGSGSASALVTDSGLQTEIRSDSILYPSGNSASWESDSGNLNWTIKREFPTEVGTVTYNEAGLKLYGVTATNTTWINGLNTNGATGYINRVVFPSPVTINSGEKLIITLSVTIPSLASSAGKTITIAAQNGVNISGVIKLIASSNAILGGSVTGAGVVTKTDDNSGYGARNPLLPPISNTVNPPQRAVLSTLTAFDTLGVDPAWVVTQVIPAYSAYTSNTRTRDIGFTWASGTPAANTAFRSILFRMSGAATLAGSVGPNNRGGYQLLLDNEMTKVSTATLSLGLRFTV